MLLGFILIFVGAIGVGVGAWHGIGPLSWGFVNVFAFAVIGVCGVLLLVGVIRVCHGMQN